MSFRSDVYNLWKPSEPKRLNLKRKSPQIKTQRLEITQTSNFIPEIWSVGLFHTLMENEFFLYLKFV